MYDKKVMYNNIEEAVEDTWGEKDWIVIEFTREELLQMLEGKAYRAELGEYPHMFCIKEDEV